MGDRLSWRLELASTPATRMMTAAGGALPDGAWNSEAVLASMGPMAAAFLGIGRTRLRGGRIGPLPEQSHLADFWLPQRGIFFVGRASFTPS